MLHTKSAARISIFYRGNRPEIPCQLVNLMNRTIVART